MSAASSIIETRAPAITLGAGRDRPHGRPCELDPLDPVGALGLALALTRGKESWWAGGVYAGDYRDGERWQAQRVIGIDADHCILAVTHKPRCRSGAPCACDPHVAMPWRLALRVRRALAAAPCTWAHVTPRGARLVVMLDHAIVDAAEYPRAWAALAAVAREWAKPRTTDGAPSHEGRAANQ